MAGKYTDDRLPEGKKKRTNVSVKVDKSQRNNSAEKNDESFYFIFFVLLSFIDD